MITHICSIWICILALKVTGETLAYGARAYYAAAGTL